MYNETITDEMAIACCLACTISPQLRVCHDCAFRIGLAFRALRAAERLDADCLCRIEEIREGFVLAIRDANR